MSEEKKEIESSEEDKKSESEKEEDKKLEEEQSEKDDFEKDSETVSANKYNQAIRKQRETELANKELERKLAEKEANKEIEKDEDEEDSFFEEKEKKEVPDASKIIDEKLKPVMDTLKKREESDRKNARTAFFETHPEYLKDSEKWQSLLDEMDNSINPNSGDDYYTQLEKAHRIMAGESYNAEVEDKKKEIASDAASGGGAEKGSVKEEFTAEDRKIMKEQGVSEDGMRAYKKKIASGEMVIL